jgi:hypothetical protein
MSRRPTRFIEADIRRACKAAPDRTIGDRVLGRDNHSAATGEQVEPAKLKVAEKREIFVETERALRAVVREVYAARFRETAAQRIEEALPERERESLARALRAVGKRAAAISTSSKLSSTPVKAKPVASATLNGRAA